MRCIAILTPSVSLLFLIFCFPNSAFAQCDPHLLQPNGGESFLVGENVTVSWENPVGCTVFSADLTWTDDGGSHWFYVANGVIGQSYVWQPNMATLHGQMRVTIHSSGGVASDLSDGTFEVHGDAENTRFALHRKPFSYPVTYCDNPYTPTIEPNYSPNYDHLPCNEYTVNGPLGQSIVYMVAGQADPIRGVAAVSFGIDYDGRQGTGIDPQYVSFIMCADGLPFPNDGGFGEFPKPKGGLRITWNTPNSCQREVIGSHGVHAVIGALYVYAYSPDLLRLTPNNNLCCNSSPELAIQDCLGGFTDLADIFPQDQLSSLLGRVQFGTGTGGYTPCSETTCSIDVADIDVNPNTLNLNSGGKFVSASIELPTGYDPTDVIVSTVKLNGTVAAADFFAIGDFNNDSVPDFTVKFSRQDVESVLPEGDQVALTITGSVGDDCTFSGTKTIRVIRPHVIHPNGGESYIAGARALLEWQNPNGWSVDHAQIHYSADGGDTWTLVADQVISQNYVWTVPQEPTQDGRVRVVLIDDQGVMGYDSNDGPFAVNAATGTPGALPIAHRLYQNSPNPFRSFTRVGFDLPQAGKVTLKVFDLTGRVVRVLADQDYPAGAHEVSWNTLDGGGKPAAAGIYFLHITAGSFSDTKRMYLQR